MTVVLAALYVPGDRPDRFDKAVAAGADLVIIDLEDAVAPVKKAAARDEVGRWLAGRAAGKPRIEVRINDGDAADLTMLAATAASGAAFSVRVPKVDAPGDVEAVAARLPGQSITALIENARGVEAAAAIAAHRAVRAITLGEADLASDLGSRDGAVLDYARLRVLYAARSAGLPAPMMSIYPAIDDLDGLRADTEQGRRRGFVGRAAVHPSQVPVIRAAFAPSDDETAWATEVVAALDSGGVTRLASGEMVDAAMVGRATAILALAANA